MKISTEELRQAMTEVREEELNLFMKACEDKDIEQRIESSKKRMNREEICRQAHKKQRWEKWSRIAAAILIVSLVSAVSTYAMEKFRQAIVNWDANLGENEDDFHFNVENPAKTASPKETKEIPIKIVRRYHLTYIADGFQEHGEDWQEQSYRVVYKKKKEQLRFEQMTKTEKTMFAPELSDQKNITVNGYDGQIGNRGDDRVLRFATDQYVFQLWTKAAVSWDEMLRMAESVAVMPPDKIEMYYAPSYIPDGYSEQKDKGIKDELAYDIYYVKTEEQFIMYGQTTLGGTTSIDSEGAKRKKVDINGWKGQMNYKKDKKTVIWATDEYAFVLTGVGDITEEEVLKMAKSVAVSGN